MAESPNILLIVADQHRWDCLGACGNAQVRTPHLDALARDGVVYTNNFTTFPVCTPARYSLLTGLYVRQHLGWTDHSTLPAGLPALPGVLRLAGYRTKAVGKMHFTPAYLDIGFDEMLLAEQHGPGRYQDDYHRWLRAEGLCDGVDLMDQLPEYREHAPQAYWDSFGAGPSNLDERHHSTTWIGDRALEALEEWQGGGHLLTVGFIKPHHPFDPPEPWAGMYDPAGLALLPGWIPECLPRDLVRKGYFPNDRLTEGRLRRVMACYYASISQIDHHVGRMVDCLRRKGLYDNTAIVYTGDHGEFMGFHHLLLKSNTLYDPLAKVPLIVKYPGQGGRGSVSDALVSSIDLAPTLLHCAGCDRPPSMAGLVLSECPEGREVVFAEGWYGMEYMVRTRTAKLLLRPDRAEHLYFDLTTDPLEMDDLYSAPAHQPAIQDLRDRLHHWALVTARSPLHLDERAQVIKSPNAPLGDGAEARELETYFRAKM